MRNAEFARPTRPVAGWVSLSLLLVSSCVVETVFADEADSERAGPPMRPFFIELRYTPSHIFQTNFRDEPGHVTVMHHDISGTLMFPIPDRGRFNISLSRDRFEYRFRKNDQLADLLEEVHETQVSAAYMGRLNDAWSIFGMGNLRWAAEQGASRSDARMETGMFMLQHQWREHVRFGLGLLAATRLDEDPLIIPTASIDWEITDRWTIRTMRGLHLLYQLDEAGKWRAGLNAEYHSRYVRLKDDGVAPAGLFRSRLVVSSLSLLYQPNPGVLLGAEAGYIPWRKLTIRDEEDRKVFESKADPGFSAAFTAGMTF